MPDKKIGIFIGKFNADKNTFSWDKYREFNTFREADKEFNSFCKSLFDYDYDEFVKEFKTPRMDVEIRFGEKKLKWFGLYEVENVEEEEQKVLKEAE